MADTAQHDQQLTEGQKIWGAQVTLAAMATLWQAFPDAEKAELLEEVLETYDDAQVWAYAVMFVESLGFAVETLAEGETYEPEANANVGLQHNQETDAPTGLYL